jgi:DNA repair ATPase RecN
MASEESAELSVTVPRELRDWLDRQADDRNVDRDVMIRRLVESYYAVDQIENGDSPDAVVEALLQPNDEMPDAVEERLDEIDEEYMNLIEDVRERVIQVKREVDEKASTDHDHADLAERLESLAAETDRLTDDIDDIETRSEELETRIDTGFENYEDVLEYLTDTTDELQERTDLLARAVVDVRDEVRRLAAESARRTEAESLQLAANRLGIRTADCGHCETEVDIALLNAPECPHCASTFNDVDEKRGFFDSATLVTGQPPALGGGVETDLDSSLDELVTESDGGAERDGTGSLGVDRGDQS